MLVAASLILLLLALEKCAMSSVIHLRVPLLTSREIAVRLGVSNRTVRLWAELDEMPAIRVGRQWRFRLDDVEAWVTRRINHTMKSRLISALKS
jgi:excisionase family DNA binding protein